MLVYFVTQKEMRDKVVLKPRLPLSAEEKEGFVPRICVSTSILGALSSIGRNLYLNCDTYVYFSDVPCSDIVQPSEENIDDIAYTGELWLLKETEFILYKTIRLISKNSFSIDNDIEINNFKFIKSDKKH